MHMYLQLFILNKPSPHLALAYLQSQVCIQSWWFKYKSYGNIYTWKFHIQVLEVSFRLFDYSRILRLLPITHFKMIAIKILADFYNRPWKHNIHVRLYEDSLIDMILNKIIMYSIFRLCKMPACSSHLRHCQTLLRDFSWAEVSKTKALSNV